MLLKHFFIAEFVGKVCRHAHFFTSQTPLAVGGTVCEVQYCTESTLLRAGPDRREGGGNGREGKMSGGEGH